MEFENYDLVVDSRFLKPNKQGIKKCLFCQGIEGEVSFQKTAHIVPELLGSNNQTYAEECDNCNSIFSKFESHLAIFFRPYLLFTKTRGKRKIPTFVSRRDHLDLSTEIKSSNESQIKMSFNTNLDDIEVDHERKKMRLTFRKTPFRPLYVYKALVRIGLSMIGIQEQRNYNHVNQWIQKIDSELIPCFTDIYIVQLNRNKFKEPFALLYRAKNLNIAEAEFPDYMLSVCFAYLSIQIILPFSQEFNSLHDPNRNLSIDIYPIFKWGILNKTDVIEIKKADLSVFKTVTEDQDIWFEFDEYLHNFKE